MTLVPNDNTFAPVRASRPNIYTGAPLDRVAERRADSAFIAAALASPEAIVAPVWRSQNLFRDQRARFFRTAHALSWESDPQRWLFLGLWDDRPVFALDLGHHEAPKSLMPEDAGDFADIRSIGGLLPPGEASVLAYARGLIHWQSRTRFCGVCGNPCRPASAGHVMRCTGCGIDHFPRSDPAVIMLVVRDDSILMGGRSMRRPACASAPWPTIRASPGRSRPRSCWASTARVSRQRSSSATRSWRMRAGSRARCAGTRRRTVFACPARIASRAV
jgi:hypothetical protein